MEKRKMENIKAEVSLLGFGCMRLPVINGKINRPEAEKMIDTAIQEGVNYIDTAYVYHGGESEVFLGEALKKHERSSFYLATKLPIWEVKSLEDADRIFNEHCKRLQTEYIDFYLLHALNRNTWEKVKEKELIQWAERLKKTGKIKYLGFSFHDEYEIFEEILKHHSWDFCQIQLNYMDTQEQAGIKGYQLAKSMNIPVVIMEPIKGGALAELPETFSEIFQEIHPNASNASWALRWVGSHSGVKVILSGMSTMEQVKDNLKTFSSFVPLSEEEEQAVKDVAIEFKKRVRNGCTGCSYCMPCPSGVNIPGIFSLWNELGMFHNTKAIGFRLSDFQEKELPKNCVECGLCEEKCPQSLTIISDLKIAQEEFDKII